MLHSGQEITIDEWPPECQVPEVVKQLSTKWIYLTDLFVFAVGDDTSGIPRVITVARTPEIAQAFSSDWDDDDDDDDSVLRYDWC